MTSETIVSLTNSCTCWGDDEDMTPDDCSGWCWQDQSEAFHELAQHLFFDWKQEFKVEYKPIYGNVVATDGRSLLGAVLPQRTEWRLDATIYEDRIEGMLYHHDAPCGETITITPIRRKR